MDDLLRQTERKISQDMSCELTCLIYMTSYKIMLRFFTLRVNTELISIHELILLLVLLVIIIEVYFLFLCCHV